ncbi:hypothetical protein HOY80DRAFT_1105832 [Tuber brumale]|nr:hypothetical protein HOY80DRAFT_1105832 [Tuber brumale]
MLQLAISRYQYGLCNIQLTQHHRDDLLYLRNNLNDRAILDNVFKQLHHQAKIFKKSKGYSPMLVLDNINHLAQRNPELPKISLDIVKDAADNMLFITVFVTSEGVQELFLSDAKQVLQNGGMDKKTQFRVASIQIANHILQHRYISCDDFYQISESKSQGDELLSMNILTTAPRSEWVLFDTKRMEIAVSVCSQRHVISKYFVYAQRTVEDTGRYLKIPVDI